MPVEGYLAVHHKLTASEREAMRLLAFGWSDDEIATALGLTLRTLQSRLYRLHSRTGLHGRRLVSWGVFHLSCCITSQNSGADAVLIQQTG